MSILTPNIVKYIQAQGCPQTNERPFTVWVPKLGECNIYCFFVTFLSSCKLWNYLLVVSKLPRSCCISCCFCILSEVLSHSKLLWFFDQSFLLLLNQQKYWKVIEKLWKSIFGAFYVKRVFGDHYFIYNGCSQLKPARNLPYLLLPINANIG